MHSDERDKLIKNFIADEWLVNEGPSAKYIADKLELELAAVKLSIDRLLKKGLITSIRPFARQPSKYYPTKEGLL